MKKILKFVSFSEKKAEKNRSSYLFQQNKTVKRGFSLVEMIISIFIFSILILMLTGTFAGFYKNYSRQKKVQKDIENAQYVLNLMAKRLRTSVILWPSSPPSESTFFLGSETSSNRLDTYDYSKGQCVRYFLEQDVADPSKKYIKYSLGSPSVPADLSTCNYTNDLKLSSVNINRALIYIKQSNLNKGGKATINLYVQDTSLGQEASEIPIQSSVSLRQ